MSEKKKERMSDKCGRCKYSTIQQGQVGMTTTRLESGNIARYTDDRQAEEEISPS